MSEVEVQKVRASASNEKAYNCPMCSVMIPTEQANLKICRSCVAGSNFKQRHLTEFEKMFLNIRI